MANFGSDNYAGVPAEVLDAIAAANDGGAVSYGDDDWTARAEQTFRSHFGEHAKPWFVTTGTAANVLALKAVCLSWESVITASSSHLNVDEAGAPEQMGGLKLIAIPTRDGKLTPADVTAQLARVGDQHAAQPRVVGDDHVEVVRPQQLARLGHRPRMHQVRLNRAQDPVQHRRPQPLVLHDENAHRRPVLLHVDPPNAPQAPSQ